MVWESSKHCMFTSGQLDALLSKYFWFRMSKGHIAQNHDQPHKAVKILNLKVISSTSCILWYRKPHSKCLGSFILIQFTTIQTWSFNPKFSIIVRKLWYLKQKTAHNLETTTVDRLSSRGGITVQKWTFQTKWGETCKLLNNISQKHCTISENFNSHSAFSICDVNFLIS